MKVISERPAFRGAKSDRARMEANLRAARLAGAGPILTVHPSIKPEPGPSMKLCRGCNEVKPLGSFHKDAYKPLGVSRLCRECEAGRKRVKRNKVHQPDAYDLRTIARFKREHDRTGMDELRARVPKGVKVEGMVMVDGNLVRR